MLRPVSASAAVLLLVFIGGLDGCGDPSSPSKEIFRAALDPVVRDAFCHPIDVMPFDVQGEDGRAAFPVVTSPTRTIAGPGSDGRSVAMLDAATDMGLVKRSAFEKPARWRRSDAPFDRQPLIAYVPTELGKPYFRAVERKATRDVVLVPSFCFAKGEVVDVVRWTEPTDLGGRRTSRVTYSYHGVDPIPVMPSVERTAIAEPKESTVSFELQNDGWRPTSR